MSTARTRDSAWLSGVAVLFDRVDRIDLRALQEHTPFYLLDLAQIAQTGRAMKDSWEAQFPNALVAFSYKTNPLAAVTRILHGVGIGAEVVSGEELEAALADGHSPRQILFDGPVKRPWELRTAIRAGVSIQIDSLTELRHALRVANELSAEPLLAARLSARRPSGKDSRFGFDQAELAAARELLKAEGLRFLGVHFNTGQHAPDSRHQIAELQRWARQIRQLREDLASDHLFMIDVGGGFPARSGVSRTVPAPMTYAVQIGDAIDRMRLAREHILLAVEPGRSLVEDQGVLVASVAVVKQRGARTLVVTDAGTNLVSSIRGWQHPIRFERTGTSSYEVYGSMCFEDDLLSESVLGPPDVTPEDLVVVGAAGGYDLPTASTWLRSQPAVYGLIDGEIEIVRESGITFRGEPRHSTSRL